MERRLHGQVPCAPLPVGADGAVLRRLAVAGESIAEQHKHVQAIRLALRGHAEDRRPIGFASACRYQSRFAAIARSIAASSSLIVFAVDIWTSL